MSQTEDTLGSKISNVLENDSFAVSFIHLELRQECKENLHEGEKKQGEQISMIGFLDSYQDYVLH